LLAAALYQGDPDRNHKRWNVATYEWEVRNGKTEIISFVVIMFLINKKKTPFKIVFTTK
jgi:hypothetical protein